VASPSVSPVPEAELIVRLTTKIHNPPVLSLDVEIMSDGRVIEGGERLSTRTVTAAGLEQIEEEVLSSPLLEDSAEYPAELAVAPMEVPVGLAAPTWTFVIGEEPGAIVVTSSAWLDDETEAAYYVPSPERKELDRLARLLADLSGWVTPDGWLEAEWTPYVASAYLLWVTVWPLPVPDGIVSGAEVTWPFEGPLEEFGDVIETGEGGGGPGPPGVAEGRCGYIHASVAADLETIFTGLGFDPPTRGGADSQADMRLATESGWVSLYLSPRTIDEFPTCADIAGILPPY
jgi:hypothetical protein